MNRRVAETARYLALFLAIFLVSCFFTSISTSYYLTAVGLAEGQTWWIETVVAEWPGVPRAIRDIDYLIAYGAAGLVAVLMAFLVIVTVCHPWLFASAKRSAPLR